MIDRERLIEEVTDTLTATGEAHNFAEVRASVEVAVDEVLNAYGNGEELDDAFVERASASVHDAWLARNKEGASEEERRPYTALSEEAKEKDRIYVRAAIDACGTLG